jgi:hypothetical protein
MTGKWICTSRNGSMPTNGGLHITRRIDSNGQVVAVSGTEVIGRLHWHGQVERAVVDDVMVDQTLEGRHQIRDAAEVLTRGIRRQAPHLVDTPPPQDLPMLASAAPQLSDMHASPAQLVAASEVGAQIDHWQPEGKKHIGVPADAMLV